MAITLMCPNLCCRKVLAVPNDKRGTRVRCSFCGTVLLVPYAYQAKPLENPAELLPVTEESDLPDTKNTKKKKKTKRLEKQ